MTSLVQNLTNLEELALIDINISSTVPESLANLSSLKSLGLIGGGLYGRFPTRIFQLPHLQDLNVGGNENLTGHLPKFHTNSPLKYLFLSGTKFSGDLPASIGNLNSLIEFQISNCNFSGTIPNSFSNLTQLTWLDLSQNSFNDLSWFTRPSSNDILPHFEYLQLADLILTKFPVILRNQSRLRQLDLEGNNLQGLIPKWMYNVSKESLQDLSLSNNVFLTGFENSPAVIPWPNLENLYLDNNMMHGSLPIPPPSLRYFLVSNNSFIGGISPFICNASSLEVLDLSYNYLSGMIHPCFGNLSQSLSTLILRSNNFGGTIPKTWAKGCLLRMLDLRQNHLQGHLPISLANCTELEYLHVGRNQINDTSPFWLGTLQQLKILVLHFNSFHGAIRSSETNCTFPNLRIIDLSHNHFSGNLPTGYFTQWDAMKSNGNLYYLSSSVYFSITMVIKGVELEYKKIQDGLTVIDFSCNRFEGDIPENLGNLKGLHVLNLSNNAFTGHIPSSFGNLTQLESLDLSQNKLSGEIPPELTQLNFLSKFDVSHNGLTGLIPHGQQFGTFENTSFEYNRGLCGRPLSKICGDSDISTPPPSTSFEENQGPKFFFEFGWKVVVMGYGCGFVFGVVIGHIVTTRKPNLVIKIFGKKQRQTQIKVNRRK
ncbi:hypothetical protein CIPAW_04G193200 [Carya illinoinensis]|uniref:Receptor-like protein 12 n=2 Tax=Carya illinoinensis TaxID=32201 RepID=A0A8T1QWZ0_CARIL|nr:hypothetical protein CIPAW_04G193200 [Carya illinoinensis]